MMTDDASTKQVRASDPNSSTWLSANAGSGKTRVLTNRVARLLLQGVEPQRILCLTYTKSAASEMQNRLFQTLGEWAMKPDHALRVALGALGADQTDADQLRQARRLFARAIETPGGLRIQTIHSFCATLLRRFPLEAGVSPRFGELDERSARLLRQEILEEMADGLAIEAVAGLAEFAGDFMGLVEQVIGKRDGFGGDGDPFGTVGSATAILAEVFLGDEAAWMDRLLGVLAGGSKTDVKAYDLLSSQQFASPDMATLATLEQVLLFGASAKAPFAAKIGAFPTKDIRAQLGEVLPQLENLMQRVEAARERRLAYEAARKTAALRRFAEVFLRLYEERKARFGWLDFDDLIARATQLVTDPSVAAWVLYRLDGGIDHVLVDEAQDTSPAQWRVIELLIAEFTAGEGAHDGARTVFVVGDQKQSIYSFQGANVAAFDEKHQAFRERFEAVALPFQSLKLEHSFRSAPAILDFVDAALQGLDTAALGADVSHIAFRGMLPGRVDIWPLIEGDKDPVDKNFEDPVDLISSTHPAAVLAERIAGRIKAMLDQGQAIVTSEGVRPVHAGDFLILVQRRSTLFTAIIRACKQRGLPIAGADRLKLGAELAVKDLLALLAFLDTPDDHLSLACVMRSPLAGLSEAELFSLAQGRKDSLFDALMARAGEFAGLVELLIDLRGRVDYLRPYDLLERVLVQHDGRRRLIARLGDESADGIDELLNQALAYEQGEVPSLTGFLIWLDAEQIDIKRQAEASGQRIRVMTVHGAKGLESEIVILPDTADRRLQDRDEIYVTAGGEALWRTPAAESPPLIAALREAKTRREAEENLRLLYVAMTRARCWLMIGGAGTVSKPASWYAIAAAGMARVRAEAFEAGLRYETGDWPEAVIAVPSVAEAVADLTLPNLPVLPPAAQVLSPSNLGGAKALSGEPDLIEGVAATVRGSAVHLLLQHLAGRPMAEWDGLADFLVPEPVLRAAVLPEAAAVLTAPDLAHLFAPGTLAEVAITGAFAERRVFGMVDRLVIGDDRVLAVDFKSNTVVPEDVALVPEGVLRQLGAYLQLLTQVYPGRGIDLAVLWTRTARLMPVPCDIVIAALQRTTRDSVSAP
ncbi:MAG: double-strand break repair helicase AddA [bacterium]